MAFISQGEKISFIPKTDVLDSALIMFYRYILKIKKKNKIYPENKSLIYMYNPLLILFMLL